MLEEIAKLFAQFGLSGLMVFASYVLLAYIIYQQNQTISSQSDQLEELNDKLLQMLGEKGNQDECCNK